MTINNFNNTNDETYAPYFPLPYVEVRRVRLSKMRRGFYYELECDAGLGELDEFCEFLRFLGRDWTYYSKKEHAWYVSTMMALTLAYFIPDLETGVTALAAWTQAHDPLHAVYLTPRLQSRYTPSAAEIAPGAGSFYYRPDAI